jgi:RimJ/RimL family protein N-acetyltransferase
MWQGDLVVLRPLERGDFPAVVRWSEDPAVSSLVDGGVPESLEECEEWYRRARSDRYHQIMAIVTKSGHLIGDLELNHITWRNGHAEMRIRIGEKDYWDQGLGTDAVLTLLRYVFVHLRLNRLYLRVYRHNRRAIACYLKCGFRKEGFLRRTSETGESKEIVLMRILREEYLSSQAHPGKKAVRVG